MPVLLQGGDNALFTNTTKLPGLAPIKRRKAGKPIFTSKKFHPTAAIPSIDSPNY